MTEKIKAILIRQSETREALNALVAEDAPDETKLTELRGKAQSIEVELREALAETSPDATDDDVSTGGKAPDAEERERREIRGRARVGAFIGAALAGKPYDGAEAEVAAAYGCPGMMPLQMLEPETRETETRELETRAVTPGQNVPAGTQPPIPYVFESTVAARLGVMFPMVPAGVKHYPVLGTAPPAAPKAKDAAADNTAAAFTLANRTAKRITGQFLVRREDLAVMPDMEESLRGALAGAMGDALDDQVLTGNGTDPNLAGLFKVAADVNAAGSAETFDTGVARFAAIVDGRYANGWEDLRAVVGVDTFAKYAGLFQANGGASESLFDYLRGKLSALIVSKRVPAKASNAQKGLVVRTRGSQIMEVPTWNGVALIRDEFTKAAEGQIVVTAYGLVGDPHLPYTTNTVVEVHPKLS